MESTQHITAMEGQFTTLGTIEQPLLSSDNKQCGQAATGEWALRKTDMPRAFRSTNGFSGGRVRNEPETRPYFLAEQPELVHSESFSGRYTVAELRCWTRRRIRRGAGARGSRALHAGDGR